MKHIAGAIGVLAVSLLGFTSTVQASALETIKERGKVLVAVDIGAPPFGMIDGNAQPAGSDVEAARLLAEDLGVELEIVPVNGPNRVPYLLSGKADVVLASFSITDERKKVIDYSEPYGVVPAVIGGPASENITSFQDLIGKTVAVTRGTTSDQELTKGVRETGGITVVRYEDDATTNTAVATGQQDYIAAAGSVIPAVKASNPNRDIEVKFLMYAFPYGVGLRKNEPELKAWLDGWVDTNLKNGKLNEIYVRHFGISLPEEMLD